jgi:hypothetical protein
MRAARARDASGLTARLQQQQVECDARLATAAIEKARIKRQRQMDRWAYLDRMVLISDISEVPKMRTVASIDDQLDAMQHKFGDDDKIPLKSHRGKRADKEKLLIEAIRRFQAKGFYPAEPVSTSTDPETRIIGAEDIDESTIVRGNEAEDENSLCYSLAPY